VASPNCLLFTRNDQNLGVRNGMLATVEKISKKQIIVQLDNENNENTKRVTLFPSQFPHIDHGYAVTIHRSQGSTVVRSFVLSSKTLDENLAYVALTRHKQKASFYTAAEIEMKCEKMVSLQLTGRKRSGNALIRNR